METPIYSTTVISTQTLSIRTTRLNVPAQFPTIQLAINQAKDGDTILVSPGTYKENIVWIATNFILASQILLTNDTSFISRTIIDGMPPDRFLLYLVYQAPMLCFRVSRFKMEILPPHPEVQPMEVA